MKLLPIAIYLLVTALCPLARNTNVSGKWSGSIDMRTTEGAANRVAIHTDFRQQDQAVTGTFGPTPEQQYPIENGTFDGTTITFQVAAPTRIAKLELTVVGEDRLEGDVRTEDGKAYGKVALTRDAPKALSVTKALLTAFGLSRHAYADAGGLEENHCEE